jgi:hypothetical protein
MRELRDDMSFSRFRDVRRSEAEKTKIQKISENNKMNLKD